MPRIRISLAHCKGCGLCVEFCPRGALVMGTDLGPRGVNAAEVADESKCAGCLNCAVVCPDAAIEIVETDAQQPPKAAR
jgi:2-oxoglutarate ferredoxin oxidoreductase subunit delta